MGEAGSRQHGAMKLRTDGDDELSVVVDWRCWREAGGGRGASVQGCGVACWRGKAGHGTPAEAGPRVSDARLPTRQPR